MSALTIDLQDGFDSDHVVISVEGREVFAQRNITTDYSLGLADSVQLEVPRRDIGIQVSVPTRKLAGTFTLDASTTLYLGVSVGTNSIEFRESDEAFTYF